MIVDMSVRTEYSLIPISRILNALRRKATKVSNLSAGSSIYDNSVFIIDITAEVSEENLPHLLAYIKQIQGVQEVKHWTGQAASK